MTIEEKIALQSELKKYRKRLNNKTFGYHLINSKWFKLGETLTIKKGEANRVLIGQNIVYEMDAKKILLNLIDLTLQVDKITNQAFRKYLNMEK